MRKSLMILLCLSLSHFLMAQEIVKQKEIGLVFNNLDNFGLTFKIGTDKSLWRFNTLILSGNHMEQTEDSSLNKNNNVGFSIKIGKEYRKEIADHLELRFGADLSFSYSRSKLNDDDKTIYNYDIITKRTSYRPGVNLVFGLNYIVNDNLVIGAEILPIFSYNTETIIHEVIQTNYTNEVKSDNSGFTYGLSNTAVLLTLAYRF